MKNETPIRVTCAIIVRNGKLLAAQRGQGSSHAGKWEFPGGKIEPGETPQQCIIREIREELNIEVSVLEKLPAFSHQYPDKVIELLAFICTCKDEIIIPGEHQRIVWLSPGDLGCLNWSEADVKVLHYLVNAGLDFDSY